MALIRGDGDAREVLLVHPGGPFWAKKDTGAWSLPKGLLEDGEDELTAARREFFEEIGSPAPDGPWLALGSAKMKSGKVVVAFATRGELDVSTVRSNEIDFEWPPRSGKIIRIPEVDRAAWVKREHARALINPGQWPLVDQALSVSVP